MHKAFLNRVKGYDVQNATGLVIQGSTPSTQRALDLYHVLSESNTNLRQPIELENQLLKHMTMDSEVGQSMLQLLQVRLFIWQSFWSFLKKPVLRHLS